MTTFLDLLREAGYREVPGRDLMIPPGATAAEAIPTMRAAQELWVALTDASRASGESS